MSSESDERDERTEEEASGQSGAGAPAPGLSETGRGRLYRNRQDKMLGGVAGGLARYFGIDVLLVRLLFFLLLLPGGIAVPLYLAAWVLIPLEDERYSIGERLLNKARSGDSVTDESWVWIVLVVVGALIVGNMFDRGPGGWLVWGGAPFWSLVLIGAGIWLYLQDQKSRSGNTATLAEAESSPPSGEGGKAPSAGVVPAPATPPPPPRPLPEPSRLGRYTFATLLVVIGLVATIDNSAAAIDLTVGQYAAIGMGVVGAGLLIGSVWGRSRPLILLGLLLLPVAFVRFNLDLPVRAGAGERTFTPASIAQLEDSYELFAGELTVDLTELRWGADPVELASEVIFGQIKVLVPSDVTVQLDGQALAGQVSLFDLRQAGLNAHLEETAGSGDGPLLVLDGEVLFGEITVDRAGSPARQVRQ